MPWSLKKPISVQEIKATFFSVQRKENSSPSTSIFFEVLELETGESSTQVQDAFLDRSSTDFWNLEHRYSHRMNLCVLRRGWVVSQT